MPSYRLVGTILVEEEYAGMLDGQSPGHLDDELLEKYAVGNLPYAQIDRVEEHLLICFECQVRMSGIDDFLAVAKAGAAEVKGSQHLRKPNLSELVYRTLGRLSWTMPSPAWGIGIAALLLAALLPQSSHIPMHTEVVLSAPRGAHTPLQAHAASGSNVLLKIDATSVPASPSYQLQLVDGSGHEVWHGTVSATDDGIVGLVPKQLAAGRYWVRLSAVSDLKLLQEYSLTVD